MVTQTCRRILTFCNFMGRVTYGINRIRLTQNSTVNPAEQSWVRIALRIHE